MSHERFWGTVRLVRFWLLMAVLLAGPAVAGRGKIVEIKGVPRTVAGLAEALQKEKKDPARRATLAIALDELLRNATEVSDEAVYSQLATNLFHDVLDKMCEPTEIFSTDFGPERFNPRADLFFKNVVKVRPGRVSKEYSHRYTKKPQGKNIDRGYRNQPVKLDFVSATSDDDFTQWVDKQGWGVTLHTAYFDPSSGVARIGLTFVTPAYPDQPGGHFERPSWIAFYKQGKPGAGAYQPFAIEPVTATDWRDQPVNLVPPKAEPTDATRKLALAVCMEQVRAIPVRAAFQPQEEALFNLDCEGLGKLEPAQLAWLEKPRDSDSPMVRAAAELKVAALGGPWKPDNVWSILRGIKHPVVKARLEEQLKKAPPEWKPPVSPDAPAARPDGGR